jgi:hypothetical protein
MLGMTGRSVASSRTRGYLRDVLVPPWSGRSGAPVLDLAPNELGDLGRREVADHGNGTAKNHLRPRARRTGSEQGTQVSVVTAIGDLPSGGQHGLRAGGHHRDESRLAPMVSAGGHRPRTALQGRGSPPRSSWQGARFWDTRDTERRARERHFDGVP